MPYVLEYTRFPGHYVRSTWTIQTQEERDRAEAYQKDRGRQPTLEQLLHLDFATKKIECAKRWNTKKALDRLKANLQRNAGGYELRLHGPSGSVHVLAPTNPDLSEYTVVEVELVQKGKTLW